MLLVAPALAHVPHDTVRALAAPGDAAPWFAVADPQDVYLLLRSDDAGATWRMAGGAPTTDALTAAAGLSDGTAVLLGEGRTWTSRDGDTWTADALPGPVHLLQALDAELLLAGESGVWSGPPGGPYRAESDTPAVALGQGPVYADAAGHVWARGDGAWEDLGAPGPSLLSAAGPYAGAGDGTVWRHDAGTWSPCGALPPPPGGEHPEVVGLAVDPDGTVLAAAAWRAPFVSTDGCATWEDRSVGDDTQFGADGGAASVADAWPALTIAGGRWVVGGWAGLYGSDDAGATWTQGAVVPADYTRGLAFSPAFDTDHRVFVGGYGAGPLWTGDGGDTFGYSATEGLSPNTQNMDLAADPADADTVFAVVGHTGWVSRDAGATWSPFTEFATVGDFVAWESAAHVWAISGDGEIVETWDGGETWSPLDAIASALAPSRPQGAGTWTDVDGATHVCVGGSVPSALVCSTDGGAWTRWYTGQGEATTAPVHWTDGEVSRVLLGDDRGLHVTDDAGATWTDTDPTGGDAVDVLVAADDGTLFLATRSARIWRSDDGGGSWTAMGEPLTAHVYVLATRPRFAAHPDLLAGTHDGLWLLHGDEAPARWAAYQRLDTQGALVPCTDCPTAVIARADAGMGGVQPLSAGARVDAWVRGSLVRVTGVSTPTGRGALIVDGARTPFGQVEVSAVGTLVEVDVAEGWHAVAVVAEAPGLSIDALEGYGTRARLSFVEPPPPDTAADTADSAVDGDGPGGRCLCGGGGSAHVFLLGGLLLAHRRREVV